MNFPPDWNCAHTADKVLTLAAALKCSSARHRPESTGQSHWHILACEHYRHYDALGQRSGVGRGERRYICGPGNLEELCRPQHLE